MLRVGRCGRELYSLTVLMISGLVAFAGDARASRFLEPSLRDYVHTAWTQHDGVPLSNIRSITQTTDGYLWITTSEEGLLRFDGVRFVSEPSPCGSLAQVANAQSDRAGGLYLLCAYRLFHRDSSGRTVAVKQDLLSPTLRPSMSYFIDRRRRLWLWGKSLRYLRPDGSEGPEIPGTERPSEARYCVFAEDSEGNIWFATRLGLMRIKDDRAENVLNGAVLSVAPSHSGGIYALRKDSLYFISAPAPLTQSPISVGVWRFHKALFWRTPPLGSGSVPSTVVPLCCGADRWNRSVKRIGGP